MTFTERAEPSFEFEDAVLGALQRREWKACHYGQGMLTDEVRDELRWIDTPIRWHADIIAVRNRVAYFVDAKTGRQDTPNHSIEQSSLAAFHDWYIHSRIPHVIVWERLHGDGRRTGDCAFVWELLASGAPLREMPYRGTGSGTKGWLWPKSYCHRFSEIFGPDAPVYGPPPEWRMREIRRSA